MSHPLSRPRLAWVKRAQALALAFALALYCASALAQPQAAAEAPQAPPYQWPRSRDYDVQHYKIVVSFDWAKRSVAGETTITLRPFKSGLKELEIDAGQMSIHSVKLAQGAPLKYRYERDEKLYVALNKDYPAGATIALTISYSATPRKGLTFITPTENEPIRPRQIWSQGQAEDNHYWFPCYDFPNDKATSELIATVEENYHVISNGTLISVRANPATKTRRWHWKMDRPYSSYLTSIVVGEFAELKQNYKGVQILSYVYPDRVEDGRLSFADTAQMMALFSDRFGFEYPHAKYAQATARDFGGGMENITATTLADTAVHDARGHIDLHASTDELVAHELAHSWFGNMLTARDWGELWLNESFATFSEALWTEHERGRDDYLYEIYQHQQSYFQLWSRGVRRPIATKRFLNPDAVFDAYTYQRGSAVIHMLRFVLGEELFWKALNHYLKKHQWESVETQQLVVAIEEATGQNLQWFFDQWIYKMGHPEFDITSSYDDATKTLKLAVKQTQKPDEKATWYDSPDFFTMPVEVAITTAAGEKVHRVWIDRRESEFTFAVDSNPLIVNFDRGNQIIKQVKFDRTDEALAYQLLNDADVMGRVAAAIELKSRRSDAATKALAEAALRDRFAGVRVEAAQSLAAHRDEQARAALVEALKDKDSRVRRAAIQGLATLRDQRLAELFINIINTDPSYFAAGEAARALGMTGAPKAYDALSAALNRPSWQDTIRAWALNGLAALRDARALDAGLRYAAPANSFNVRVAALQLLGAVGKGSDAAFQSAMRALKEDSLQLRLAAVQSLAGIEDARALPALEEMAKAGSLPPFAAPLLTMTINRLKAAGSRDQR